MFSFYKGIVIQCYKTDYDKAIVMKAFQRFECSKNIPIRRYFHQINGIAPSIRQVE
jgi:hypothetical protein